MRRRRVVPFVGENMRTIREELGLTLRDVAEMVNRCHQTVHSHEQKGFKEPPWAVYAEAYRNHPDLRHARYPSLVLDKPDLFQKSPLFLSLVGMYGREKLAEALSSRTNEQVIEDLRDIAKDVRWRAEDIDCIRIRVGVKPKRVFYDPERKRRG